MRGSGVAIMGIGIAEGENRALKAVDSALSSPLLEETNIQGAKHILVNITSGTKEVTMDEIFSVTEFVQEEAGEGANLIWGNCHDDTLGDKIAVTVIATGFESRTVNPLKEVKNEGKIMVSLDDEPVVKKDRKQDFFGFGFDNTEGGNTIDFEPSRGASKPKSQPTPHFQAQPQEPRQEDRERLEEDRRRRMQQEQARRERLRSNVNTMKLNNPQTIIEMEN
jgi:cell division protein FtsZ